MVGGAIVEEFRLLETKDGGSSDLGGEELEERGWRACNI